MDSIEYLMEKFNHINEIDEFKKEQTQSKNINLASILKDCYEQEKEIDKTLKIWFSKLNHDSKKDVLNFIWSSTVNYQLELLIDKYSEDLAYQFSSDITDVFEEMYDFNNENYLLNENIENSKLFNNLNRSGILNRSIFSFFSSFLSDATEASQLFAEEINSYKQRLYYEEPLRCLIKDFFSHQMNYYPSSYFYKYSDVYNLEKQYNTLIDFTKQTDNFSLNEQHLDIILHECFNDLNNESVAEVFNPSSFIIDYLYFIDNSLFVDVNTKIKSYFSFHKFISDNSDLSLLKLAFEKYPSFYKTNKFSIQNHFQKDNLFYVDFDLNNLFKQMLNKCLNIQNNINDLIFQDDLTFELSHLKKIFIIITDIFHKESNITFSHPFSFNQLNIHNKENLNCIVIESEFLNNDNINVFINMFQNSIQHFITNHCSENANIGDYTSDVLYQSFQDYFDENLSPTIENIIMKKDITMLNVKKTVKLKKW